jgi:hypothetical protein
MPAIYIFVYLQLLDFLTTVAGFRLGASEASPFIAKLIHASSPIMGVATSKVLGLAMGGVCIATNKLRLVGWINYWYAALVVWNLSVIVIAGKTFVH